MMSIIWKETTYDWRAEIAEIRHRLELIEQRDGEVASDLFDSVLAYGLSMAQQNGMDAAIQAIDVTAEETPAAAAVLQRLARHLRSY